MTQPLDESKLQDLIGKVIGDVAGSMSVFLAYIGDQAGLFAALDGAGEMTVDALAAKTGINRQYLNEWLGSVSAAGYVTLNPANNTFSLTEEQGFVFSREGQPRACRAFSNQSFRSLRRMRPQWIRSGRVTGARGAIRRSAASAASIASSVRATRRTLSANGYRRWTV